MRWLDGITEFEQALRDGDGQGSLACFAVHGVQICVILSPGEVLNQHQKHGVRVAKDKTNPGKTRSDSRRFQIGHCGSGGGRGEVLPW